MSDGFDMKKIFVEDDEPVMVPAKDEKEYTPLPSGNNIVPLPSNGKLGYPGEVEFRDIMVSDEEVLSTATEANYGRVLNGVLKSVMMNCSFYEKMSVHDRDYALLWIWATNYTPKKNLEIECAHCKTKSEHVVDMTKLPFSTFPDGMPVPLVLPIKKTGGNVSVYPSTVEDELAAEAFCLQNPKTRYDTALMATTISVGVNIPLDKKIAWISANISGKEMGYIRKYHKKMAFGLDSTIEYECPECHGVTRGELPFQTEDILFPVVSDDFDEFIRTDQGDEDKSD